MHPGDNCRIEETIRKYSNMLYRICLVYLASEDQAEDALQETFIRYMKKAPKFNDAEHEKAWLIRVATNICRDICRFRLRNTDLNIDDFENYCGTDDKSVEILELVLNLPQKHKEVILLYYVEGYKVNEISELLSISVSAVKKRLQYARKKLKLELEKEETE